MPFSPFVPADFQSMHGVTATSHPPTIAQKIDDLRHGLDAFPEFRLEFFRKHIVRRPGMRGDQGLVFGPPRWGDQHWYLYTVGGDQDQVQLNIGMNPEYLRIGLGFQIGRQVSPKIPAFQIFQTFLGLRPPLPFRDAFYQAVKQKGFRTEDNPSASPEGVLSDLETYVVPADGDPVFIFVGALWEPGTASTNDIDDFRNVFNSLIPFYQELILAGGRYSFSPP